MGAAVGADPAVAAVEPARSTARMASATDDLPFTLDKARTERVVHNDYVGKTPRAQASDLGASQQPCRHGRCCGDSPGESGADGERGLSSPHCPRTRRGDRYSSVHRGAREEACGDTSELCDRCWLHPQVDLLTVEVEIGRYNPARCLVNRLCYLLAEHDVSIARKS